jgi:hypothetical protein
MSVVVIGFFQFVLLLGAMGAFIAMIIILLLALVEGAQALGARQWAGTSGAIVDVHITSALDEQDPKQVKILYRPVVSYIYFVKGKQYVGDRIAFGSPQKYPERAAAEKVAGSFNASVPVTVYYNPQAPTDAVLKRESPAAGRLGRIAVAVIGAGIFSFIAALFINQWAA